MTWTQSNLATQGYCLSGDQARALRVGLRFPTALCLALVVTGLALESALMIALLVPIGAVSGWTRRHPFDLIWNHGLRHVAGAPELPPNPARRRHSFKLATIWLAAGARYLGGRVLSLEHDPRKCEAWRSNIADAGLEDWAELIEGDAFEILPAMDDVFDVGFLDAEKEDYERLFQLARGKVEPGGLFVADNVLSHADALGAYSRARQEDPTLESVTVPLDRGLELSVVLASV